MYVRNWNCPENANKELVKTMKEMGIKIGDLKAQNVCLEDKQKECQKNEEFKKIMDAQNKQLQEQLKKYMDAQNTQLQEELKKIQNTQKQSNMNIEQLQKYVFAQNNEVILGVPSGIYLGCNYSIIEKNNISVVMVTGGWCACGDDYKSVELLHLNGSRLCSLPSLPDKRSGHTQSGPTTCGGGKETWKSCVTFTGGKWKRTHTLGRQRTSSASWASPQGVLIMGGTWEFADYQSPTTTELLKDDGTTQASFNIEKRMRYCAIDDDWEVVLTGGEKGTGRWSMKTVTKHNMEGQATALPSLNTGRLFHACGKFRKTDGSVVDQVILIKLCYLQFTPRSSTLSPEGWREAAKAKADCPPPRS